MTVNRFAGFLALLFAGVCLPPKIMADSLPSWNDTAPKKAIMAFVEKVTKAGAPDFVPVAERIAVFDNDGTLWPENPVPTQLAFALDEVKRLAEFQPEWQNDTHVQAALNGDIKALLANNHAGLMRVLGLTHAGMTTDEFNLRVEAWLANAKHPRFDKAYVEVVYQPMLELLNYLRENGFKTYIVSGGGADFMRVWTERVYGIPPEQVIGSTAMTKFEMRANGPALTKTAEHVFVDDKAGKPVGIHQFVGRRPIASFGNSDGDLAMLQYTTINNPRPSLGVIIHHTDAEREYAYDANPESSGKLVDALNEAPQRGWVVVDMKDDWKQIWPEGNVVMTSVTTEPAAPAAQAQQPASATQLAVPVPTVPTTQTAQVSQPGQPATPPQPAANVQPLVPPPPPPPQPTLFDNPWRVEDITGGGVVDRVLTFIRFGADGRVSGNTGCNPFTGTATVTGEAVSLSPLETTRRACKPAILDQEVRFLRAIEQVRSFEFDENGVLRLKGRGGSTLLRLSAVPEAAIIRTP